MWPSLFDDKETTASFERLRGRYDKRMAFMVASVDATFRRRLKTGHTPIEAYARSVAEVANINAIVEGFSPDVARKREEKCTQRLSARVLMIQSTRTPPGFCRRDSLQRPHSGSCP
jgi:hypothetical protein